MVFSTQICASGRTFEWRFSSASTQRTSFAGAMRPVTGGGAWSETLDQFMIDRMTVELKNGFRAYTDFSAVLFFCVHCIQSWCTIYYMPLNQITAHLSLLRSTAYDTWVCQMLCWVLVVSLIKWFPSDPGAKFKSVTLWQKRDLAWRIYG